MGSVHGTDFRGAGRSETLRNWIDFYFTPTRKRTRGESSVSRPSGRMSVRSLPSVHVVRQVNVLRAEIRCFAVSDFFFVVSEGLKRVFPQNHDRRDVDQGHGSHRDVREAPQKVRAESRTQENDKRREETDSPREAFSRFTAEKEENALIDVVEISQQRREGEQDHRRRDENRAERAEDGPKRFLNVRRAGEELRRFDAGTEAHERGRGADEQRVDEDGKELNESLFHGVRNVGGGGRVGGGTDTGFVTVETAPDPEHETRPAETSENGLEVEGITEDLGENAGKNGFNYYTKKSSTQKSGF